MTDESKLEKTRKPGKAKGSPKTGGRQKGTPNKNHSIIQDALDDQDFNLIKEFKAVFSNLTPEAKLAELKFLMRFCWQKLPEVAEPPAPPQPEPNDDDLDLSTGRLLQLAAKAK